MANDVVYMNKDAWTGILDQIRESSGNTDKMTASQAKEIIAGLSSGGPTEITDASYLFYMGSRCKNADEVNSFLKLVKQPKKASYMFSYAAFPASMNAVNVAEGLDFSMCEDISGLTAYAGSNTAATVSGLLSKSYPMARTSDRSFSHLQKPITSVSLGLTVHGATASNMFVGDEFSNSDFSGSDMSGVTSGAYMFQSTKGTIACFPDNFLENCGDLRSMFDTSGISRIGDVDMVLKFPKGFAKSPKVAASNPYQVSLYSAFSHSKAYSIDINSDFFSDPRITYQGDAVPGDITIVTYGTFDGATKLKSLIIRTSVVIPHGGPTFMNSTVSASIHVFVPRALVDTYKAATNWSAMADRIFAVEDYTKDGTIDGDFDYDKAGISLA